jgi:NitT/TauT family transport system ATP-binding protein
MASKTECYVYLEGIKKRFDNEAYVLENINLNVTKGEFISFLGPSGCGKSTLLRLIAGLIKPTEGTLLINNTGPELVRTDTAFIFQDANLMPWRRSLANVELPLLLRGESKVSRQAKARAILALVGLKDAEDKFPWQLSGGMKMRVSIARALSTAPEILLLDEPFGALDEITRDKLNEDLLKIKAQDQFTAFFVTHSINEALFLSNRIVILGRNPGRIEAIIDVPFSYPRTAELRETPDYFRLLGETTHALRAVF